MVVAWADLCLPKEEGDIRLRSFFDVFKTVSFDEILELISLCAKFYVK